jgi:hypothetical protein
MACCEDVRHHVHVPDALPLVGRHLRTADDQDAGVGAEEIDRPLLRLGIVDHAADVLLAGDVGSHAEPPDLVGDGACAGRVPIDHDDGARSLGGKPRRQRAADAARSPGDDAHLVPQLHVSSRRDHPRTARR